MLFSSLFLLFSLIACGDEAKEAPPQKETISKTSAPAKKTDPPKQTMMSAKPPLKTSGKQFDPLAGKSLKDICSSNGLSLIKWPFEKLQAEFHSICCSEGGLSNDDMECSLDWPFSDVPSCSEYDRMRNEIFAHYGRAFTSPQWKKAFEDQKWYTPRADYSDDWLSETANKNVAHLIKLKKEKSGCMD